MKTLFTLLVLAFAVFVVPFFLWADEVGVKTFGQAATIGTPAGVAQSTASESGGRLGIAQRRKLGLTPRNLLPIVRDLKAKGQISADDPDMAAVVILQELQARNPKAWTDEAAAWSPELQATNWDRILEFLEKLLPLLITLFAK